MAKPSITTRATKGSALSWTEGDQNLENLRDATITIKAGTGGTDVVSDLNGAVTLVAGTNVSITGDNTAKTVTINSTASGIASVSADTAPTLGGNLNVNGKSIVSLSNGNIAITPNGTGKVILDGLNWPTSDGSMDQVLKTDGSGNLSWAFPNGPTIANDTTTNATFYPTLASQSYGSLNGTSVSSTKLSFNPSTGVLSATGFSGSLTGNASSATNVGITNNNTAATEHYITFVSANSGNNALKVNSSSLRYFPQQGALFANSFQGAFNSDSFRINTGIGWSNWTTAGLGFKSDALTYNENTATGTKASAYVHSFQTPTLTSTGVLTVTDASTLFLAEPVAGTNTTITNKYSLITGGGIKIGGRLVLKELVEPTYSLTYAATLSPNAANGSVQTVTLTGNVTINAFTNPVAGQSLTLIVKQDATGSRTLTSTMKFAGGTKTLSTAANSVDIISVFYDGTTYWASLSTDFK